ncbi:MAG: NAD(P)(+) transhydrogenase (Re/Si-specific) subunit alpha, partial [Candidatus Omnitrophica bacterium]|nr:NAD(P)(+) transhydrogenase (Re/Si-specific) subunit alpha [Candidatus Omnitrophota bacterium]
QTKDGYAKALTPDQLEKQRQGMAKVCAQSDIVITTAQLFGRPAPRIITGDMIARMKPGSIIVDMAVESGGNVEGSKANEEIEINGVKILGIINLPGQVALDASQMLGNNLVNLMETFWDKENKTFTLDLSHDIIKNCLITHGGNIVNETILNFYNKKRSRNGA